MEQNRNHDMQLVHTLAPLPLSSAPLLTSPPQPERQRHRGDVGDAQRQRVLTEFLRPVEDS